MSSEYCSNERAVQELLRLTEEVLVGSGGVRKTTE